jgi:hypothetical protein
MDTEALNDSQTTMAHRMSKLHDSPAYWDSLLGYFECLLGFNYQTCPKGWIPSKRVTISDQVRSAMIWAYNWYLQADAKDRQVKINAWVEISQTPGFNASETTSWRHVYVADDMGAHRSLIASQSLVKFMLYSLMFPQQVNPVSGMTVEQIADRLEELEYDYDQVEEDVCINTGHIYRAIFDAQVSPVIRVITKR